MPACFSLVFTVNFNAICGGGTPIIFARLGHKEGNTKLIHKEGNTKLSYKQIQSA